MSFNYDLIDSTRISKFKCIQLKDSSVYFGEIAWMDENGVVYVIFLSLYNKLCMNKLGRATSRPCDQSQPQKSSSWHRNSALWYH